MTDAQLDRANVLGALALRGIRESSDGDNLVVVSALLSALAVQTVTTMLNKTEKGVDDLTIDFATGHRDSLRALLEMPHKPIAILFVDTPS